MFALKQSHSDIQTVISFITTSMKAPGNYYWKKFQHVMQFLNLTTSLIVTMCAKNSIMIIWWVDSSYEVHTYIKSHNRGVTSFGQGCLYSTPIQQKLNTKISTKEDLVEKNYVMQQHTWTM